MKIKKRTKRSKIKKLAKIKKNEARKSEIKKALTSYRIALSAVGAIARIRASDAPGTRRTRRPTIGAGPTRIAFAFARDVMTLSQYDVVISGAYNQFFKNFMG